MVESLHLASHGGGIGPGVLALDQSVMKIKDVEQPEAHRRTAARDTGELAHDVPGGDRLIHDMVGALKPAHATEVDIRNRLQDAAICLRDSRLASEGRARMRDV